MTLKILLSFLFVFLLSACDSISSRIPEPESSLVASIGAVVVHAEIRSKSEGIMIDFLEKHPSSIDDLVALDLAWIHFWENENPFTRSEFDLWIEQQVSQVEPYHQESIRGLGNLLWSYLEADAEGYVDPSPRTRRIVDSFVAGLRQGYRIVKYGV